MVAVSVAVTVCPTLAAGEVAVAGGVETYRCRGGAFGGAAPGRCDPMGILRGASAGEPAGSSPSVPTALSGVEVI